MAFNSQLLAGLFPSFYPGRHGLLVDLGAPRDQARRHSRDEVEGHAQAERDRDPTDR